MTNSKRRPLIAVDLDDVLSQTNEFMRIHVNENYGQKHSAKDYLIEAPYHNYWEIVWAVDETEGNTRYASYSKLRNGDNMRPIQGALSVLKKLKKDFDLIIITARGTDDAEATKIWLEKNYPSIFDHIEFVPAAMNADKEVTKAMICRQLGVDYVIDDAMEHCELIAEAGIQCLLFGEYGWSRYKTLPPLVSRVTDWSAVEEYFNAAQ